MNIETMALQAQPQTVFVVPQDQANEVQTKYQGNSNIYEEHGGANDNYDENMKPWEKEMGGFYFKCCTENIDTSSSSSGKQNTTETEAGVVSVYHREGSQRLIIKTKKETSMLAKAKGYKLLILLCFLLVITGVVFKNIVENVSIAVLCWLAAVGVVAFIISRCCQANQSSKEFELVTQSIPIRSIFYVERQVSQSSALATCCCSKKAERETHSNISIGYNRSNLSRVLQAESDLEDYVTVRLESIQAYNLHQYLNSIIVGAHPLTNDAAIQDVLPR